MATEAPTNLNQVASSLRDTLLGVWSDFVDHSPYLVAGVLILFASWGATFVARRVTERVIARSDLRMSLVDLIERFLSLGIWAAGLMLAAMVVFPGLTPASALGALGVASIAISFAFKDIFENFFAGVLLLWRFPFEKGDFIESGGILGEVDEVTIRMTRLRRPSGELVVLPNSFLFKNPVDVLTHEERRRVQLMAGVGYDEDVEEAVEVIQKAVESCPSVDGERPIQVFPSGFGASSVDIEVAWWTGATPLDVRRSRGEVVVAIKRALDDAGIEIPFPYRTLTFKEPLPLAAEGDAAA